MSSEILEAPNLSSRSDSEFRRSARATAAGDLVRPAANDEAIVTLHAREMQRVLFFRRSMDLTRDLAVLIVAAMALVVFGLPEASHLVLFLGSLTVFALALIETRTHRFAAVSEQRLRAIEQNYFAPLLDSSVDPAPEWNEQLAKTLSRFEPPVGFVEAFAARISRNYFLIFVALDACWFSKLYLYPGPAASFVEFVHRADLGLLPGWLVLSVVVPVWGTYIVLVVWLLGKNSGREPSY